MADRKARALALGLQYTGDGHSETPSGSDASGDWGRSYSRSISRSTNPESLRPTESRSRSHSGSRSRSPTPDSNAIGVDTEVGLRSSLVTQRAVGDTSVALPW